MPRVTTIWRCLGGSEYHGTVSPKQDYTRSPTCETDQGMHRVLHTFICTDSYLGLHEQEEEEEETGSFGLRKWRSRCQGMHALLHSFIYADSDSYLGSLEKQEQEVGSFRLGKWLGKWLGEWLRKQQKSMYRTFYLHWLLLRFTWRSRGNGLIQTRKVSRI